MILAEMDPMKPDHPFYECVHSLFEEQVRRTPEAVAAVFEGESLAYRDLNARANRLAHHLRQLGVGPEALVGLYARRSLDVIVGILATLKAGGAYMPLDPAFPRERLRLMIEDANPTVLLTQRALAHRLPPLDTNVFQLDADWPRVAGRSAGNPASEAGPANPAYVIFTSGSTGRPKGVVVEHRNLVNYVRGLIQSLNLPPGLRYATVSTFAGDLGNTVVFPSLVTGGQLHVIAQERASDPGRLAEYFQREAIEVLKIVPSHLLALLQSVPAGMAAHLVPRRVLVLGGEASSWGLITQVRTLAPACRIFNHYGPTEATVGVLVHDLQEPVPAPRSGSVPLGRPLPNSCVHVVDSQLRPVGVGVPGELLIGGAGVARGYLNRPDLTAERFIPDHLGDDRAARLYKTGDRGRWLPDGTVEFLGRTDEQVKIRGYRVELDEIVSTLELHPGVRQAVVVARGEGSGGLALTVYIVVCEGSRHCAADMRRFLRERLPDYMTPSRFVMVPALPLTPNGKVDRNALPPPDETTPAFDAPDATARTTTEELLAGIWSEVLGLNRVRRLDNFLELGGHSLQAMQVIARVRAELGVELPVGALFDGTTVAAMAAQLDLDAPAGNSGSQGPVPRVSHDGIAPLSFAQQRLWFLDQLEPGGSTYNLPLAVRLHGRLNVLALENSLGEILRRNEGLRTRFASGGGNPLQVIQPFTGFRLARTDLSTLPEDRREQDAARLASEETRRPFDLATGPVFRARLLELGAERYILMVTTHHIASDAWSMGILTRELSALYGAFSKGDSPPLRGLKIQYADFAVWQRNWLRGGVLERGLAYWKRQLGGSLEMLEMRADPPRPAVQAHLGRRRALVLPGSVVRALLTLGHRHKVTLFMTLLAAFKALLHRYTGQENIVVGAPVAGRSHVETEELIGFFVNTLVLRTDLSGNPTFEELLKRVRTVSLDAFAHQEIPFEKLVEELHPERNLSHTPLFKVMFNMFMIEEPELQLPGLTVERMPLVGSDSKLDLTLYVRAENQDLHLDLVFNCELFEAARMEEMLGQFKHLLEQIADTPGQPIRSYSLVTDRSRPLLPNPAEILPEPGFVPVTRDILSWAKRSPAQPAVIQGSRVWTYGEFATRVESIARELRSHHGIEPGGVVAVAGPRSAELIAGVAGVLLAGGVLLTIDRNLPAARQRLMLTEARARHLLYIGDWRNEDGWLRELEGLNLIHVPRDQPLPPAGAPMPGDQSPPDVLPRDAAYIFFTSGTNGTPRGVLGSHAGLAHFLNWQKSTFAIGPGDRCAHLTSLSFDVALRDIFLPLVSGATLCLPDESADVASGLTLRWLARESVTAVHAVPSLAQAWLAGGDGVRLRALRWTFFAGEPLPGSLVTRWREALSDTGGIVNLYGPTETTLAKCFHVVPGDPAAGIQPIGGPLPQTQALVLNENRQLCGVGESGEIVIRTPFRAFGYINAPDEQRERFVQNPFRNDPNDVVYCTGDRGRYAVDGSLEILGRADDQVKIRGVRIEPAEVSAVLGRHPGVSACAVTARHDSAGDITLVGYVVPSSPNPVAQDELRSHLAASLPPAMVPSAFVYLDSLPLTPNGKVDRRALPEPGPADGVPAGSFVAPRTSIERSLAGIWRQVLKLDNVGVHDSFFQLGGHSLTATQLVARIRREFRLELPLRTIFEMPTIERLASHLSGLPAGLENVGQPGNPPLELEALVEGGFGPPLHARNPMTQEEALYGHTTADQPAAGGFRCPAEKST